jgi:hypothetical protein
MDWIMHYISIIIFMITRFIIIRLIVIAGFIT